MPRLRRVDCSTPGIVRRRSGRGFTYVTTDGGRVSAEVRARIQALAIPPAWIDVWICPDENGHLQAVGTDAAGRRQYLYHERWRKRRDQEKFDHALEFARALPHLRAESTRHLALEGFPAELADERLALAAYFQTDVGYAGQLLQQIRDAARDV